jgi:putative pyruvate formate lyase activating enzyme
MMNLHDCTICPRECHADRFAAPTGYCGMDAGLNVASVCLHRGEEPVIGGKEGICNIFFAGCNLHCIYCQNHEISQPCSDVIFENDLQSVLDSIARILDTGIKSVGFVSPSHMVPQMLQIIEGLHSRGLHPVIVYNTSGYDKAETIRSLNGIVDVYLPDFKYVSPDLSYELSGARNYPSVALKALKEMYWQKGSSLITDDDGRAINGMLVRHLVLPGKAGESKKVLQLLAEELSTGIHLSLMSQYHPAFRAGNHPWLNRPVYKAEYEEVVEEMHRLGFRNGWIQDMDSNRNYLPDFDKEHPFEG